MKNVDAELLDSYIKDMQNIQKEYNPGKEDDALIALFKLYKKYVYDSEKDYSIFINKVLSYHGNADLFSFINNNA